MLALKQQLLSSHGHDCSIAPPGVCQTAESRNPCDVPQADPLALPGLLPSALPGTMDSLPQTSSPHDLKAPEWSHSHIHKCQLQLSLQPTRITPHTLAPEPCRPTHPLNRFASGFPECCHRSPRRHIRGTKEMREFENQLEYHGRKVPILACCPCTYMCLPYRAPTTASPFPMTYFKKKPTEKPTLKNLQKQTALNEQQNEQQNPTPRRPQRPVHMHPKWAPSSHDFTDRWFSNSLIFKGPLMCLCGPLCPHFEK